MADSYRAETQLREEMRRPLTLSETQHFDAVVSEGPDTVSDDDIVSAARQALISAATGQLSSQQEFLTHDLAARSALFGELAIETGADRDNVIKVIGDIIGLAVQVFNIDQQRED